MCMCVFVRGSISVCVFVCVNFINGCLLLPGCTSRRGELAFCVCVCMCEFMWAFECVGVPG